MSIASAPKLPGTTDIAMLEQRYYRVARLGQVCTKLVYDCDRSITVDTRGQRVSRIVMAANRCETQASSSAREVHETGIQPRSNSTNACNSTISTRGLSVKAIRILWVLVCKPCHIGDGKKKGK